MTYRPKGKFRVRRRVLFEIRIDAVDSEEAEDLAAQIPLSEWFDREDDMTVERVEP